jgi:hypothetical protein
LFFNFHTMMTEAILTSIMMLIMIVIMVIILSCIMLGQQPGKLWTWMSLFSSDYQHHGYLHHHHHHHRITTSSINNTHCPRSTARGKTTSTTKTPSWSDLVHLERYPHTSSSASSPSPLAICTLLPANRTASFLWNAAASRIVEWTVLSLLLTHEENSTVEDSHHHHQQQQQYQKKLEQELIHMIRHDWRPHQMRRSIKGHPKSSVWTRLLDKIHQRLVYVTTYKRNDDDADDDTTIPKAATSAAACVTAVPPPPVVHILVLTSRLGNDVHNDALVVAWQDALQSILNQVFFQDNDNEDNNNKNNNENKKLVIFQVQVQARSKAFTTQVYTESMRHGLFHHHRDIGHSSNSSSTSSITNRRHAPDLIVHAMGHANMMLEQQHDADDAHDDILRTVNFTDNLRHALQHFIRASLLPTPALEEQCPPPEVVTLTIPPAVLLVNDYYNHRQEYYHRQYHNHSRDDGDNGSTRNDDDDYSAATINTRKKEEDHLYLKQAIYSRVVQQLADHYQLGLISHSASGIQRLEWINEATRSTTAATTSTSSTTLGEPRQLIDIKPNSDSENILLTDQSRHSIQVLWTLLYSMLQYTIDECSNLADQISSPTTTTSTATLVPAENLNRIENVIPPYLDGNLSLRNVSPLWKQQEVIQRQQAAVEPAKNCPVSVADTDTATVAMTANKEHGDASVGGYSSSDSIPPCSLALGPPMTAVDWRRKLAPVVSLQQQQHDFVNSTILVSTMIATGWKVLDNGILRATDKGAHLSLHVPVVGQQQQQQKQGMRAILFVVHQTIAVPTTSLTASTASAAPTILEWSIQTEVYKAPLTRQIKATTCHADHCSSLATPVAMPYIIEWTHTMTTTTTSSTGIIKVDFELVQEDASVTTLVDIAALFICTVAD